MTVVCENIFTKKDRKEVCSGTKYNQYPQGVKDKTFTCDLNLKIDTRWRLNTCIKLDDNRDAFDFQTVNFPFLSDNIPETPAYEVYFSLLLRYSRAYL